MTEPKKQGIIQHITQAWLVILLALVFGTALASVDLALKPRIKENKRQKTLRQIPILFSQVSDPKAEELEVDLGQGKEATVVRVSSQGQDVGWLIPGKGPGFADTIELLIAVDAHFDKVMGLAILKQSETPGLGDYISKEKEPFRLDFASGHLTAQNRIVVQKATQNPDTHLNQVQAISGATISSESVVAIVNRTLDTYKSKLTQGGQSHGK